ncbi:uncharacterized protein LOC114748508 [Neltuma alba]|uniref:uncharacterized protein LOC114748508 n=1 Tax=Neltuma alba TaxID=207710 RepID=UPI0010A36C4A|nr:uncharacterized protein LOC114748508 [Prosopis alba]
MKDRIQWILKSEHFELIDLPNNYFVFRTSVVELRKKLLFDGPWMIQGHYLAVQRWSPNFNPYCNRVKKVAIWVRVPTPPMHMYSEECMWELGNMIGKALKVDLNTLTQGSNNSIQVERGKFVRVSVEVDLNRKLQSRFVLRKCIFIVEYEGLNVICFKCGEYGYKSKNCSLTKGTLETETSPEREKQTANTESPTVKTDKKQPLFSIPRVTINEEFGTWM